MSASSEPLWRRLQLGYFRRLSPYRQWKRWLSFGAAILATAWVVHAETRNDHAIYSSGVMSVSHAAFSRDCQTCHSEQWTRFKYASDDNLKKLAFNNACLDCHGDTLGHNSKGHTLGHDPHLQAGTAWHIFPRVAEAADMESKLACSTCHVEHQGEARLSDMVDEKCVECHIDLTALSMMAKSELGPDPIEPRITVFSKEGHPRFRSIKSDPGRIRFTHAEHLMNERYVKEGHHQLQCDDCHRAGKSLLPWRFGEAQEHEVSRQANVGAEPVLQNAYMGPIRYSLHCKACHQLVVAKEDRALIKGKLGEGRVPHTSPPAIRSYLRRALTDYFEKPDRVRQSQMEPKARRHRDPFGMGPHEADEAVTPMTKPADTQARGEQIAKSLRRIEKHLYGTQREADKEPDDPSRFETARCALCHIIKPDGELFGIQEPHIPNRWYVHSSFNHAKHKVELLESDPRVIPGQRNVCTGCHKITENSGTRTQWKQDDWLPSEVLIPDIESCTRCHAESRGSISGFDGGVDRKCVLCHTFHLPPRPRINQDANSQ